MRPRTFILIILVLLLAVAAIVGFLVLGGNLDVAGLLSGNGAPTAEETTEDVPEVVQPAATATPTVRFVPVVVTTAEVPIGARIEERYLSIEMRPETNIAVQANYTFSEIEEVANRIARADISRGQAVLNSMIALSPTDLAGIGSDLALYVDQGNVAMAVPINRYTGAAYAMRPGDRVDVLMSLNFVKIDDEFQTALPNIERRINQVALQDGRSFLFDSIAQGRLELIPTVNLVPSIGPSGQSAWQYGDILQIPRRVTQLTVQQAEVLWVGTWELPGLEIEAQQPAAQPTPVAEGATDQEEGAAAARASQAEEEGRPREERPDMIILSMPPQDALALKWAMDRGVDLNLALRAQGDSSVFATTSVSLPQLVEQGGLTIPERADSDVHPRADEVDPPELSPLP
ncbi:MAG TPA: RcpC/CpaB family pilus assembly protein [Candidatus Sulfomarinibacteraceae bacterium]|nr:RcpC/CpaB family pilus assembly protein [Candidatus Sulfomarinibacteraceae bacterium]